MNLNEITALATMAKTMRVIVVNATVGECKKRARLVSAAATCGNQPTNLLLVLLPEDPFPVHDSY